LFFAGVAHAQDAALKQAQAAFDQAQLDYLNGDFDAAAEGFKKAHASRPFPQFLYNVAASYHMKGKATSDIVAYQEAVKYYEQYITDDPQAQDKKKVQKAIKVLNEEIARLKKDPPKPEDNKTPSQEVKNLGDAKIRGLVVFESEPQGASIYLDGKDKGEVAKTPWSTTLEGEHTYLIEKRGHKVAEGTIQADPTKLFVLKAILAEQDYLGFVDIRSNVPGADVFMDDKSVGAVGKTPYKGNVPPGKHTFYISADGYDEAVVEIEVIAGESHEHNAELKGSPVGYLNLRGAGIEKSEILVDGKVLCERGPCRKPVKEGTHTVTIRRSGYKSYTTRVDVQARTEISVKASLAKKPGRGDAIAAGVVSAIFAGGGIYLGLQSSKIEDAIRADIEAGDPPPDSSDPRLQRGKIFAIAADGAFVVSGIVALTALYYMFRDKGAPSTGQVDVRAIALEPQIGPGYAGMGMAVNW
jgi:tetratricopeptide (TPR) repeat protein